MNAIADTPSGLGARNPRAANEPLAPHAYVQAPLCVEHADAVAWTDSADVLVVGYGGAGVSAALEARAAGADVLALDRFAGGGATALCGGVYYGGGTRQQREAGYEDDIDAMYRYLKMEVGDVVQDSTLRKFCEDSNANLQWLESHGVPFGSKVFTGKRSYPPGGYDIYFSGNEKVPRYAQHARSAPRGHRVVGEGYTGYVLMEHLLKSAQRQGVRLRAHCAVTRLVVDAAGRVIGVEARQLPPESPARQRHATLIGKVNKWQRYLPDLALKTGEAALKIEADHGQTVLIRARQGVVLSTGSFAYNRPMMREYAPLYAESMPWGTLGCDGSGVRLGQSVGGVAERMDSVTAWRSISPPTTFVDGIVVNLEGRRIINEDAYLGHLGRATAEAPKGRAWVVIDRAAYRQSFRDTLPRRGETLTNWINFGLPLFMNLMRAKKGATPAELARRCGFDAAGLEGSIRDYNGHVASGIDPLGKDASHLRAIGAGPYYAVEISISSKQSPCPAIPMGGLNVDETTGHVVDGEGRPIEGLFAAGRAAKGIPAGFYISGTSVADCVFSGRRAGRHAAGRA